MRRAGPDPREPARLSQRGSGDLSDAASRGPVAEPAALRGVYAATYGRLVGQLYLVTGDLSDAEDAVQEALTRAAARWARLRDYDVPEAWVRRVAMNLASDGFRRARRRLAVAEALRALPLAQREVVVLHHLLDLPVERVAAELGVPVGTVKSRLARARNALAARLAVPDRREPRHPGGARARG